MGMNTETLGKEIGVEKEAVIKFESSIGDRKMDIILLEDFDIQSWGNSLLEAGTMLSIYGLSTEKYFDIERLASVEIRLLKAHNKGNNSKLVGTHFSLNLINLNGMKYREVKRDSHLLALTRKAKIESLFKEEE